VNDSSDEQEFLATLRIGDIVTGTVTGTGSEVTLDGFPARSLGEALFSWRRLTIGERITAEVTRVDLQQGRVWLHTAAIEYPELWAFLAARRPGEVLTGTVAAIKPFGVFVALDDGPEHPVFPGVGFVTWPELTWGHIEAMTDVVRVGQRVSGEFLVFDTHNGEARLSLKALQPNPFLELAAGQQFRGTVTKVVPFAVFVAIRDRIEGLVHVSDIDPVPAVGDELHVTITDVDPRTPRVSLRPTASSGSLDG
jgi:small subunit ribosomal protein S1